MMREFLQNRARNLVTPLGGLVRVGGGPNGDRLAILNLPQLLAQQIRGVLLDEDLVLEVFVGHFHEFVRVAGITVFAGKLAAPIRIDRPGEGQIPITDHSVQQ